MAIFSPLIGFCDRHVRAVNLVQNLFLLVTIVAGLGSGASFMAAHVDLQNMQETAQGMVEGLGNEILIASQLATTVQPLVLLPGAQAPDLQVPEPDASIQEARERLHDAAGNWSQRRYDAMRKNLIEGYDALGVEIPVTVAETNLLQGRIECISASWPLLQEVDPTATPEELACLFEVPNQAFNLGLLALASGFVTAVAAALSPPGTSFISSRDPKSP